MIRVLIVDDHNLVREGLKALLEKADDIEIVGEAGDGHEAVQLALSRRPDVVIMDITMPRINGIQAIAQLRRLRVTSHIVVLSVHADESLVEQALQNGAMAYILKRSSTRDLLAAVRAANRGELYLSEGLAKGLKPIEDVR